VRDAIDALAEPQQAVVTLRDVEGLSTQEVAALLGLSEANVRVIVHRGRARVREIVEEAMKDRRYEVAAVTAGVSRRRRTGERHLDGTLSRRQRRRLEKHLAQCDACSAYLDQMRATIAASGTVGPEDLRARSSRASSTCSVNTEPTSEGPPWLRLTLQSPSTAPVGARTVAAPSSSSRPPRGL